jgi:hypothetical protein
VVSFAVRSNHALECRTARGNDVATSMKTWLRSALLLPRVTQRNR